MVMAWLISLTSLQLLGALILLTGMLYRWLLPKPIPGIPYNKVAAERLWGDAPDMLSAERVRVWQRSQFAVHGSPIVQLFMSPFQKPWVFVADFWTAQDVMVHRIHEFDRSSLTADSFSGVLPQFQMNYKSADVIYKHNKDLVKDLMTPSFLHEVGPC